MPAARSGATDVQASLTFARGGGRTFLARQSVPYPFHITRPHHLDAARPDLATLYLQSAAGGLYRGDRLGLALTARPGAAVHVTSQAATVVHRSSGGSIAVDTTILVHAGATLALTTDPFVLFPDTHLSLATTIVVAPGASALLIEGLADHDPGARAEPFRRVDTTCRVSSPDGRILMQDRSRLDGTRFAGPQSPLGPYRAWGTAFVLGAAADAFDPSRLDPALGGKGVLVGASRLPNAAGWSIRLLARDGGLLAWGLEQVFSLTFADMIGAAPARRRK